MCDCYTDYCKGCGQPIEMHLGDYNTDRIEVAIFCEKCIDEKRPEWWGVKRTRSVTWLVKKEENLPGLPLAMYYNGRVLVVSLTRNAWVNRGDNNPNYSECEVVPKRKVIA